MAKFLTGALVGVVAGLLLAPQKGTDLRNELSDTTERWRDQLNKLMGKSGPSVDDLRALLSQEISGLNSDVKHRILTILDEAEEMSYSSPSTTSNTNTTNKNQLSNGVA
jgi:gas vesicle protein